DQPMEDELSDPGTSRDKPVMVGEIEHANEQLTTITVIDDSLIHQETVFPESAGAASCPSPQPFWHGDSDIGMDVGEGVSRDYNISAHIQVPPSITRVSFGWNSWV